MSKKYTTKYFIKHVRAAPITLWNVFDEMNELCEELLKGDLKEARNEYDDVMGLFLIWLTQITRINLTFRILTGKASVERWYKRQRVWKGIFVKHGLTFRNDLVKNGSNYKRREKIILAFLEYGWTREVAEERIQWEWVKKHIDYIERWDRLEEK